MVSVSFRKLRHCRTLMIPLLLIPTQHLKMKTKILSEK